MPDLTTVIKTLRPNFLVLTPVCVFLGVTIALFDDYHISILPLSLAFIGALFAHIAVNTLNEYLDFTSGLDLTTKRTAFSGGSGALPDNPKSKTMVLTVAIVSIFCVIAIGIYFMQLYGWRILPLGMIGILLVMLYTTWINRLPWLCLIAPGLGFGLLMVVGTQFVITGNYIWTTFCIASIPFWLINNLLLLNQYPDVTADKTIGRHHFPIAYGVNASNIAYLIMWLISLLTLLGLVLVAILPIGSLLALLPLGLGVLAWKGAKRYGFTIGEHPQYLGFNVLAALLTPLLLAISLLL